MLLFKELSCRALSSKCSPARAHLRSHPVQIPVAFDVNVTGRPATTDYGGQYSGRGYIIMCLRPP